MCREQCYGSGTVVGRGGAAQRAALAEPGQKLDHICGMLRTSVAPSRINSCSPRQTVHRTGGRVTASTIGPLVQRIAGVIRLPDFAAPRTTTVARPALR